MAPIISICIPAYKNITFLKRLLDSIAMQSFKQYEVVVTDDSPDESVKTFVEQYNKIAKLQYYKNKEAVGTPENWNAAIRKAKGKWIKLMHDDDWFATPDALSIFYQATQNFPDISFFFSAFTNITAETGETQTVRCSAFDLLFLKLSPLHLFKRVYVGNPSCTLVLRDASYIYDNRFKFVVDFEFYIRIIRSIKKYKYIAKPLINVGFSEAQVTKYTFQVAAVQVPENLLLLEKLGVRILRNPFVYDYYWRLFRNLKINNINEVRLYHANVPVQIRQMLQVQKQIPQKLLRTKIFSKTFMVVSFLKNLLFG